MKKSLLYTVSLISVFAGTVMAQNGDVIVNITEPVSDYNVVQPGERTSGKITVNVNGSDSDSPYTISGSLNLNAGGDVYTDNWDGANVIDKTADSITLNVNSGTIQTKIFGQTVVGTNVYGNVVMNINGGVLGKGTQTTADCNILGGLGQYAVTDPMVVIYGDNTLNIGSNDSGASQPTI